MSDFQQHLILHRLDDPLRLLHWTLDEAACILAPLLMGSVIDHPIVGIFISVVGTLSLRRLKRLVGGGTLRHFLYWYFPHNRNHLKVTPPSYIREYVG